MYQFRGEREGVRTLAGLSGGVAAVGTSRLLDVKRAAACSIQKRRVSLFCTLIICLPCLQLLSASSFVNTREFVGLKTGRGGLNRDFHVLTTSPAEGVSLVVALAKAGSTLRCNRC